VEELLAERGVAVTYETIGQWVRKFGPVFAQELRRRGRRPSDKLHLDEVALKIKRRRHWLWRAVDQHASLSTSSCRAGGINTHRHCGACCRGWSTGVTKG
jgi:transposase-like protein